MITIEDIRESINEDKIRITDHADEEAQADNLLFEDIRISVERGELIKHYEHDKPYPSCLISGRNSRNEPIHSVWAYNAEIKASVLITVYRPDPKRWMEDLKTRRRL